MLVDGVKMTEQKRWNSIVKALLHPDDLQREHATVIMQLIFNKGSDCIHFFNLRTE